MKPTNVTTHEHFFAYHEGGVDDFHMSSDFYDGEDEVRGRYDAYETADDECGVWSPTTDAHFITKNFPEARRMARALCEEYKALNP